MMVALTGSALNIPNMITLFRIVLTPVLIICLIQGFFLKGLVVFILAGITDALDGFLARVLRQKTIVGVYLDPLADKALVASAFITLSILTIIPGWLTVIVISRDLVILFGVAILSQLSVQFEVRPAMVSKATTALQFLTILAALLSQVQPRQVDKIFVSYIFWATAILTAFSGFVYILRGIRFLNHSEGNQ